jgi:hypothetical protein
MTKQNITLTVDKQVVQKAKQLGVNMSKITELALRGFSFSAKDVDWPDLINTYKALFAAMRPLIESYGASVKVAIWSEKDSKSGELKEWPVYLQDDGAFYAEDRDEPIKDIWDDPHVGLDGPEEILSNLIEGLHDAATRRKEWMKDLEMAKRIVDAITSVTESSRPTKAKHERTKPRSSHA